MNTRHGGWRAGGRISNGAKARNHLDAESDFLRKILVELGVLTR